MYLVKIHFYDFWLGALTLEGDIEKNILQSIVNLYYTPLKKGNRYAE